MLLIFPTWGVCSFEPSGGLFFEAMDSMGENSLGKLMPS